MDIMDWEASLASTFYIKTTYFDRYQKYSKSILSTLMLVALLSILSILHNKKILQPTTPTSRGSELGGQDRQI